VMGIQTFIDIFAVLLFLQATKKTIRYELFHICATSTLCGGQ
jgi:hypothetical protein